MAEAMSLNLDESNNDETINENHCTDITNRYELKEII